MDTTTTTYRGRRSPLDRIPTTYSEAAAFLGSRSSRKVGNNTYVVRYADAIGLRLHSTAVVTFYPDGRARLSTGGWHSVTTKDRLNRVLRPHGFNVYAKALDWHLAVPNHDNCQCAGCVHGRDLAWFDGMVVRLTH